MRIYFFTFLSCVFLLSCSSTDPLFEEGNGNNTTNNNNTSELVAADLYNKNGDWLFYFYNYFDGYFSNKGDTRRISVNSRIKKWFIRPDVGFHDFPDWIHLDKTTGYEGVGDVNITVDPNNTGQKRSHKIYYMTDVANPKVLGCVYIEQAADASTYLDNLAQVKEVNLELMTFDDPGTYTINIDKLKNKTYYNAYKTSTLYRINRYSTSYHLRIKTNLKENNKDNSTYYVELSFEYFFKNPLQYASLEVMKDKFDKEFVCFPYLYDSDSEVIYSYLKLGSCSIQKTNNPNEYQILFDNAYFSIRRDDFGETKRKPYRLNGTLIVEFTY